jgi:hypothetical protein
MGDRERGKNGFVPGKARKGGMVSGGAEGRYECMRLWVLLGRVKMCVVNRVAIHLKSQRHVIDVRRPVLYSKLDLPNCSVHLGVHQVTTDVFGKCCTILAQLVCARYGVELGNNP